MPANAAATDAATVTQPRRLSRRRATHRPSGAMRRTVSSLTSSTKTIATTYMRQRRSRAANIASGTNSPRYPSGWKFSMFVPFTAGLANHAMAASTPKAPCPSRCRA